MTTRIHDDGNAKRRDASSTKAVTSSVVGTRPGGLASMGWACTASLQASSTTAATLHMASRQPSRRRHLRGCAATEDKAGKKGGVDRLEHVGSGLLLNGLDIV